MGNGRVMALKMAPQLGNQRRKPSVQQKIIVATTAIVILFASQIKLLNTAENLVADEVEKEKEFIDNNILSTRWYEEDERNVSCDSSPCNGFFAYDAPSKDKNASFHVLQTAVAAYSYGPETNSDTNNTLIFMPNITNHPSCVQEWKESRPKWVDR